MHGLGDGGGHAIGIVDADEQGGQLPDGGQVHGLPGGTLVAGAVAEEDEGDAILLAPLLDGQCSAVAHDGAGTQNAVGTKVVDVGVRNVHGAALTLTHAGLAGQNFRHHIVGADALADGLTVAPVGAEYVVLRLQGGDSASCGGLLADA